MSTFSAGATQPFGPSTRPPAWHHLNGSGQAPVVWWPSIDPEAAGMLCWYDGPMACMIVVARAIYGVVSTAFYYACCCDEVTPTVDRWMAAPIGAIEFARDATFSPLVVLTRGDALVFDIDNAADDPWKVIAWGTMQPGDAPTSVLPDPSCQMEGLGPAGLVLQQHVARAIAEAEARDPQLLARHQAGGSGNLESLAPVCPHCWRHDCADAARAGYVVMARSGVATP